MGHNPASHTLFMLPYGHSDWGRGAGLCQVTGKCSTCARRTLSWLHLKHGVSDPTVWLVGVHVQQDKCLLHPRRPPSATLLTPTGFDLRLWLCLGAGGKAAQVPSPDLNRRGLGVSSQQFCFSYIQTPTDSPASTFSVRFSDERPNYQNVLLVGKKPSAWASRLTFLTQCIATHRCLSFSFL